MEMHQLRYFLAVAQTLNFTRAAEQCNVSQPALTRAIQQLEQELSGPLLRREGKLSHLTELGVRMLPLMRQCYESALAAKSLASTMSRGEAATLSVMTSQTIDLLLISDCLRELQRVFPVLELSIRRDSATGVAEHLKKGDVDLAIAGPLDQSWDRLDAWPLFNDKLCIVLHRDHALATCDSLDAEALTAMPMLTNLHCESAQALAEALDNRNVRVDRKYRLTTQGDLLALLEANLGAGVVPLSTSLPPTLKRMSVNGLEISRAVSVYAVAGRPRSAPADAFLKLLRARDWSSHAG
jgi:DNA-binding transcriptional LysR family regulator